MNCRFQCYAYVFMCLLNLGLLACKSTGKQNVNEPVKPAQTLVIPEKSEEDLKKEQTSRDIMAQILENLKKKPEYSSFSAVVDHFKERHLFVNAENQGYLILAVKNSAIGELPEYLQKNLQEMAPTNEAYQLKFLLHHILIDPRKKYVGMSYRSLLADEVEVLESRNILKLKNTSMRILSSEKISEDLKIMHLDTVIYR